MKRVVVLFLLVVLASALLPGLAWAEEAPQPATTAVPVAETAAVATSALITLPPAEPLASAEEAKAETEWQKSGDGLNLIVALLSLGAIAGIVVWGVIAQRRVASA